jgi:hypothetical protein
MIDMDIKKHKQKELVACRKTYLITYMQQLVTAFGQPPPDASQLQQRFPKLSWSLNTFKYLRTHVLWSLISHIKVNATLSVGNQTKGFLKNYYMNSTLNYHQIR